MTWRPSANILRPGLGKRGSTCYPAPKFDLIWPPSTLNGGGDYSIDFDGLLAPGEFITSFQFDAGDAAELSWTNLFGTIATAWLRWKAAGTQTVVVCALTSHGNSHQVEACIAVSARAALFPVPLPPTPGTPAIALTNEIMDSWLRSLPTDLNQVTNGWFNNAGIPTYRGERS